MKAISNNPTHVKLYIGKEFNRIKRRMLAESPEILEWHLKITKGHKGKCSFRSNKITVPMWAIKSGKAWALYYMLHEFAHILTPYHYHDETYRAAEDRLLDEYGITIKRLEKSPYPNSVFAYGKAWPIH